MADWPNHGFKNEDPWLAFSLLHTFFLRNNFLISLNQSCRIFETPLQTRLVKLESSCLKVATVLGRASFQIKTIPNYGITFQGLLGSGLPSSGGPLQLKATPLCGFSPERHGGELNFQNLTPQPGTPNSLNYPAKYCNQSFTNSQNSAGLLGNLSVLWMSELCTPPKRALHKCAPRHLEIQKWQISFPWLSSKIPQSLMKIEFQASELYTHTVGLPGKHPSAAGLRKTQSWVGMFALAQSFVSTGKNIQLYTYVRVVSGSQLVLWRNWC